MNAEAWARVKSLLADAADLPAPDRERFVVERCPDPELRREVLELLLSPAPLSDIIAAGTLKAGALLGPYVIERLLGAGGMGEVFRARDTTLGRDVAIKILPRIFATDPHRLARFRREAQVLASLNHPHIGAIYGVEEADGVPALVLELVEGDTLADRIAGFVREAPSSRYLAAGAGLQAPEARGQKPGRPLPILDALNVARQVAEALEAAHERGIIHRDLKPANIKITPDGVAKVLDFGLAKIGDAAIPDLSPAAIVSGSGEGLILGTPAYMSPEQARGMSAVDKRTDIWAFGCVCYEMLAGRAAFVGETLTDTLAAVVQHEPDWLALPNRTPSAVRRLLQRCLEKDPRRRLRDIGDVRLDIEEALTAPAPSQTVQAPSPVRWPSHVAWALVALSIAAVIGALGIPYILGTRASEGQPVRFTIVPPLNTVLPSNIQAGISALSADGRRLAFVADRGGTRLLWVRSLDSLEVRLLPGTEGAESPFWSPDNQTVAFTAQGKLKAIDAAGGSVRTLCDEPGDSYGGSWSPEGTIVFATLQRGLSSVPSIGGSPTTLTSSDATSGETHLLPRFLPDGRHFVYLSVPSNVAWLGSLDSREGIVRLLNANSQIQYVAPGYLVFVRRATLMAQRFDAQRAALVGEAVPVVEGVLAGNQTYGATFTTSLNGVLVYRHDPLNVPAQLTWVDRTGRRLSIVGIPGRYRNPELSPDGASVVFEELDSQSGSLDVDRLELERGVMTRLTSDPGNDAFPVWSPDGHWIMFGSDRDGGVPHLYRMRADGTGEVRVLRSETAMFPQSWAPDGKLLVHQIRPAFNLGILPLVDGAPRLFDPSKSYQGQGQVSPDGRWLLYASGTQASGGWDVYVQSFPTPGLGKWKVSREGGASPRWSRDGREIFYYARDSRLMAVPITSRGSGLEVGTAVPLFEVSLLGGPLPVIPFKQQYDVSSDGRFLLNVPVENVSAQAFTVVVNWQEELKQRVPTR